MDEMRELVTVEQAERVIRIIAISLPAAGIVLGALAGAMRRRLARGVAAGLLAGAVGPAVWALWRVYNGVTGIYGLDSVRGLLVNLALFVGIGLAVGIGAGVLCRRRATGDSG
jgi:hypothetical protein